MMKDKILKMAVLVLVSVALLGCTSKGIFHEADEGANKNLKNIKQLGVADNKPIPPVVSKSGYYADKNPIAEENRPAWLKNTISISGRKMPLSFVMQRILRNTSVLVKYQSGVHKDKPVSIEYSGTVKGALEQLATQTNYAYEPTDTDITWEAYVTKTFNISFMPGASTYQVGQTSATSSGGGGGGGSSSGGGNVSSTTGSLFSNDQQFTGLQASSLSVWTDLKNTLEQLKSHDGKIAVSEATTMVTVYDHPTNVEAIAHYIEQLNQNLSKQVRLKVQVLEVDLDKEHTLGIDWALVQQWWGQSFRLAGNLGSAANVTSAIPGAATSATTPVAFTFGNPDSSHAVLQALSTQGKVSVVTEPSVVTMSNQVAEVRIATDTSYLQSVESNVTGGVSPTVSTTLTPGMVTDGVILYILPKIKDNKVYLQISSISSNLASLNTINSAGATNQANNSTLNAIQVPIINEKRFNIRSLVANNSTLIIGGFKQVQDITRENRLFGLKALGGQGAQTKNIEMVILITPVILES